MTGRDLLDAIGYVDESLLERCWQTEQTMAKDKMPWLCHSRKYVSIAACLFLLIILGITYWQYSFYSVGNTLISVNTQGITASLEICAPERTELAPGTEVQDGTDGARTGNISNGTDSGLAKDSRDETGEDLKSGSAYGSASDYYQPDTGILPDTDESSDTESKAGAVPENPGDTDILSSSDTQIAKIDGAGAQDYSKGIKIEAVKEIPGENVQPTEPSGPGEVMKPAEVISAKNIFAENTVIIRGTVKKIQHFHAFGGQIDVYFSVVSLKVKEAYRTDKEGNPQKGSICKVYLPDVKNPIRSGNSMLGKLVKGREVVVMPYIAGTKTGIHNKGNFFAFLDVSDYYFEAETAESHLFLKTKTGVLYNTRIYRIPHSGKNVTLDDVGAYIRKMIKK